MLLLKFRLFIWTLNSSPSTSVTVSVSFFEVDEFYGENEGLVVAEVELASENEPFEKPDFIGQEVTGDIRYYNSQLMKHPFKEWK